MTSIVLNTEQLKQNNYAFSLDVIFLYSTVHSHPTIDIISEYIMSKNLYYHKLTATDIHKLLSIIVDNTYFTYNGNYLQTNIRTTHGIQYIRHTSHFIHGPTKMSSTIHLPIMHILHKIYRRYTCVDIIQRRSYHQNIDRHIQFKIEPPDNTRSLSLLDFKMQFLSTGKIYSRFYTKPTTKNLFVHFKSAHPLSAKTN